MAKNRSEEELQTFLKEHLLYERKMLNFTFARLHDTEPGYGWNMAYESFAIHARNLIDFFRHNRGKSTNNFIAVDYVHSRSKSKYDKGSNLENLHKYVFHMSTKRGTDEKPNLKKLQEIAGWVDLEWEAWIKTLPDVYKSTLTLGCICPKKLKLKNGVSLATACTSPIAIVSSSTQINAQLQSNEFVYVTNTKL